MADQKKYYRTRLSGLQVVVGKLDPTKGEVAPPTVKFEAYEERYQGDKVSIGYLATDNSVAIEKLKNDGNVEEISQKDFEDATNEEKGAKRASV